MKDPFVLSRLRLHARDLTDLAAAQLASQLGLKKAPPALSTPWHLLRAGGEFRTYFAGRVLADFGAWLQTCAQVLLAYRITHSVGIVILVPFAQFVGPLILGPWAGVLTGRFGGCRTLYGTQVVSVALAATLAALDFAGVLNAASIGLGAVFGGLAYTFGLPARNVTVQRLVPAEKLKAALGMDMISYNLGRAVAFLVIGVIGLADVDPAWAFAASAASSVVFSVVLWQLGRHLGAEPERRMRIRDGLIIARSNRRVLILLLMVAAGTIAIDPILTLGPTLARQLHASTQWSDWFTAALGTGAVLGSLRRPKHQPALRLAATALASLALCGLLFLQSPVIWISMLAAFGAGVSCLVVTSVTRATLIAEAGPHNAAVMAVWVIAWAGSKPIASLLDGTLVSWIGPQWTGLLLETPALVPIVTILMLPRLTSYVAAKQPLGLGSYS